jgi:2-hydroxychromene-2-carboxylate isomerase
MRAEWANGRDIGQEDVLFEVGKTVGLDLGELRVAIDDPERRARLESNWEEAQQRGVIGVPTFIVDKEIYWGQDRIDYVEEHLRELRARRL